MSVIFSISNFFFFFFSYELETASGLDSVFLYYVSALQIP